MIVMRKGTSSPSWATSYGADGVLATRSAARAHDDGSRVWPHVATVKKLAKRVRRVRDAFEKENTLSPTCTSPPTTLTEKEKEKEKFHYIVHLQMNGKGGEATRLQYQPQNQRFLLSKGLLRLSLYARSES